MERKFVRDNRFSELYHSFMNEYLELEHMSPIDFVDQDKPYYFLPHHGVLKENSSTTKLRTVFDASCKTNSGTSLNDILMTGRKLQTNICDLILHFRQYNVVFCCDIKQMYRQILIHPEDRNLQLILWRDHPSQPVSSFQLNTVTYGVNSSPYLAIRTLHQLANDHGDEFPQAAHVLRHHTYVDDIISGADSESEALALQSQVISLLKRGCFELRKWVSNSPKLLCHLPDTHLETPKILGNSETPQFTVLGLQWSPVTDAFSYNFQTPTKPVDPTKRTVLSSISQIYDPCGFLVPFIMLVKSFMQLIWTKGLPWDLPLPLDLQTQWQSFTEDLKWLSNITIPRAFNLSSASKVELHGFCDASESGYAAVVYLKCVDTNRQSSVNLMMAKSRVAPLKRVTIPRLELCAAHLLAQLVSHIKSTFSNVLQSDSIYLWSDSAITLTWLQTPPYRLKTYVANRVAQTQELLPTESWRHDSSEENPADCASKGLLISHLINHKLWWNGPSWLSQPSCNWPVPKFTPVSLDSNLEMKPESLTTLISTTQEEWGFLTKFSSWSTLLRTMAFVLRFINNCRDSCRQRGFLMSSELNAARIKIFSLVQEKHFSEEIKLISEQKTCSKSIQRLNPFLDENNLIRVGGRLSRSSLPYDARHPILLPKKHHVVNILVDFYHKKYLHSGAQLTQSLIAQSIWILSARSVIRSRIFRCVVCFRNKPRNKIPLMGDLPTARVTPSRPFLNTGLDYGGPFNIKIHNLRSVRITKAYICIFVCLVTKAVHIEAASDLSIDAFIAALTRFVSRRGLCNNIYSDCGTNFVGAHNTFQALFKTTGRTPLLEFASRQGINFHFNPPAAPHQGGLWEAAIKSAKHHLRRVIGEHVLTLSEFMTLTTQVEAILNSRPLTPLSNDPSDVTALTPGHFLIGSPLVAVPEKDFQDVPSSRLKHWHLVKALHQRIWKRWHLEYIHNLQQRGKWNERTSNLRIGDLVLVHQPTAPLSWPLARIIDVSPGKDNVVRVVHLKTQKGILTRPAHKVFPLPVETEC